MWNVEKERVRSRLESVSRKAALVPKISDTAAMTSPTKDYCVSETSDFSSGPAAIAAKLTHAYIPPRPESIKANDFELCAGRSRKRRREKLQENTINYGGVTPFQCPACRQHTRPYDSCNRRDQS